MGKVSAARDLVVVVVSILLRVSRAGSLRWSCVGVCIYVSLRTCMRLCVYGSRRWPWLWLVVVVLVVVVVVIVVVVLVVIVMDRGLSIHSVEDLCLASVVSAGRMLDVQNSCDVAEDLHMLHV